MLRTRVDEFYRKIKSNMIARKSSFLGFVTLCALCLAWFSQVTASKFAYPIGRYATALMVLCYVSPIIFLVYSMFDKKNNPEKFGAVIDSWGTMAIKLVLYNVFLLSSFWQIMQHPLYLSQGLADVAADFKHSHPWIYWFILVLLGDFIYYWGHRFSHTTGLGWAFHRSHHSMPHLTLANGPRSESLNIFLAFMPSLFSYLLCLPIVDISFSVMVNVGLQLLILHTEMNWPRIWLLEFLVNVPSHHRVHHYIHPVALDKNYSGLFIIWDRMFGTFQAENEIPFNDHYPKQYGIIGNHKLDDPFSIMFGGVVHLARACRQAESLSELWRLLAFPPGVPIRSGQEDTSTLAQLARYERDKSRHEARVESQSA